MNILSRILQFIGEKLKTNGDDIDTLKTTTSTHTSNISSIRAYQSDLNARIITNSNNIKTLDTKIDNVSLNGLPYLALREEFCIVNYCTVGYTTASKTELVFTLPLPKLPPTNWSKVCFSDFNVCVRKEGYIYGSGWNSSTSSVVNSPLFNIYSLDGVRDEYYDTDSDHYITFLHGYCNKTGNRININGLNMTVSITVNDTTSSYLSSVVNNDVCALNFKISSIWFE